MAEAFADHRAANDSPTPYASVTDKLAGYFTKPNDSANVITRTFSDVEVQNISRLLAQSNVGWSRVPRIYIILRLIDSLNLLNELIDLGVTDHWLPFDARALPKSLSPTAKARFVQVQSTVLTKSIDLEKGEDGRHRHFGRGEPLPFEVKSILGEGGFGQVEKVLSLVSFKEYARKRIPRAKVFDKAKIGMRNYVTELEALKRLKHQHIVELVGSYTDPVYLGLIMSPVAECNLAEFLPTVASSPDKSSLLRSFFGYIACALSYLHISRIRHMDIKPQNMLINRGEILLTDFGVARDLLDSTQSTTVGTVQGISPRYCAPEVVELEPRNYTADIWSLGCVFLEMFTILKGKTLDDMKAYFDISGSRGRFIRNNSEATQGWMNLLSEIEPETENVVLEWTDRMLQHHRHERVSAEVLFESIRSGTSANDLSSGKFCGICCLYPDTDSVESDGDLDTPARTILQKRPEHPAAGPFKVSRKQLPAPSIAAPQQSTADLNAGLKPGETDAGMNTRTRTEKAPEDMVMKDSPVTHRSPRSGYQPLAMHRQFHLIQFSKRYLLRPPFLVSRASRPSQ